MKKHAIYFYWLLLLTPTVLIGVAAFWALKREEERFQESHERAVRDIAAGKAELFAKGIRHRLELIQRDLMQDLVTIADDALTEELAAWDREEPLVRNVFVWAPPNRLQMPDPNQPETREQLSFMMRYEALFSGRVSWASAVSGSMEENRPPPDLLPNNEAPLDRQAGPPRQTESTGRRASAPQRKLPQYNRAPRSENNQPQQQRSGQQTRQSVRGNQQSGQPGRLPPATNDSPGLEQQTYQMANVKQSLNLPLSRYAKGGPHRQGWIAWFSGSRLHLLGWAQMQEDGKVRGVELETMALLSRLYEIGPVSEPDSGETGYALIDGSGQVLYHEGLKEKVENAETLSVAVGPALPHWQVRCVFHPSRGRQLETGRYIMVLGGLLVAVFLAAILVGGSLLLVQARRHALEAAQKTSFVSNVSHELKTPLTSIRMYAELLFSGKVKDADKRNRYLTIIVAESQRLGRLVNNVLDFSRLEQGRKKYHVEPLPLAETVSLVLESQLPRIEQCGMVARCDVENAAGAVLADRDALEQILINLIDNACKYAADGKELTLRAATQAGQARISVLDRGAGIPREQAEKVFDKFHRVDDKLTREQDGVGLGLSITRRLAQDMDGDLSYSTRPGGGSCFNLVLPLADGK